MKPEDMTPEEKHVLDTIIHSPLLKKPSIRDRWNWRHLPEAKKEFIKDLIEAGNKIVKKYKKEHPEEKKP